MSSLPLARPRCSVFIATSVDGYIAREDGRIDWLHSVDRPGEDYGYQAFFDSVDGVVMGRTTYNAVLGFGGDWPFAGKRCVVLTHRPPPPRATESFSSETPADLVARLGREGLQHLYVDGGTVIRQFLAAGLVDQLTLSLVPVLLGGGIRLFDAGAAELPLVLEASRAFPSGLTQNRYRAARSP